MKPIRGNSLKGYAIAVGIRKKRTLLVEGKSDRRLVKRLAASCNHLSNKDYVLDTAEMISADSTALGGDIGNKSKVLAAYGIIKEDKKFAAMVDREWEGLWDSHTCKWLPYSEPNQERNLYTTLGHSIENYSFRAEVFHRKILAKCYESLCKADADLAIRSFHSCLKMALAVSQEAMQNGSLSRMSNVLSHYNFAWEEDDKITIVPTKAMEEKFAARTLGDPEVYCSNINAIYLSGEMDIEAKIELYLHGHLGEEVLVAAMCSRLLSYGASSSDISNLSSESIESREVALKEHLEGCVELPEPFERVIEFLRSGWQ